VRILSSSSSDADEDGDDNDDDGDGSDGGDGEDDNNGDNNDVMNGFMVLMSTNELVLCRGIQIIMSHKIQILA